MKSIIATGILLGLGSTAMAAPYLNVEANSGFSGTNYNSTVIDNHIGYEGYNWYVQGGPSIFSNDGGGDSTVELSAKAGGNIYLTERLNVYGEVSFSTDENDNNYGTKAGVKYTF